MPLPNGDFCSSFGADWVVPPNEKPLEDEEAPKDDEAPNENGFDEASAAGPFVEADWPKENAGLLGSAVVGVALVVVAGACAPNEKAGLSSVLTGAGAPNEKAGLSSVFAGGAAEVAAGAAPNEKAGFPCVVAVVADDDEGVEAALPNENAFAG